MDSVHIGMQASFPGLRVQQVGGNMLIFDVDVNMERFQ